MNNINKANAYAKDKKWDKAEKMLLKHIKNVSDISGLHFSYNSLIDYSYKQRKEDVNAIDRCLSALRYLVWVTPMVYISINGNIEFK